MIIRASENQLEIATPAKVNLFLELLSHREDGFHELETVMSSVSIYDRLRFVPRKDSEIRLSLSYAASGRVAAQNDAIPADDRNLIQKTLRLVRSLAQTDSDERCCTQGIDVHLEKTIPSAAGLGGASSNAAATLVAANRLWNLNWSLSKLASVAGRLGSDIAFFLYGGTAVCRGRGERIHPLQVPAGLSVVVAKPSDSLSTAKVFGEVSIDDNRRDSNALVQSVRAGKPTAVGKRMFNRLQQFAEP